MSPPKLLPPPLATGRAYLATALNFFYKSIRVHLHALLARTRGMALLVGGALFARHRVKFLLGAVFGFCCIAAAWYAAILAGVLPRTSGSSPVGYLCGLIAFGIICFRDANLAAKDVPPISAPRLYSAQRDSGCFCTFGSAC